MNTQPETFEFGPWMPDQPSLRAKHAVNARNVIPQLGSYRSLNGLSTFTNALSNACLGTFWALDASATIHNFAGDQSALYKLDGTSQWQDVSGVAVSPAASWEFTRFGDRVIAVNEDNSVLKFDLGTDAVFSALAGTPPSANRIATIGDFVMLGDIPSQGPNFVRWCGYNNTETWTPSLSTQADFQELYGNGGRVQRIVPGKYATIFCERSIFIGAYEGPPRIFTFDEVERNRGTPAPNSVTWSGEKVFYYGWDGFYVFEGGQSRPISAERVTKWFVRNAAVDAVETMRGAVDHVNTLVMWAFKSSSSSTTNDRILIYNWQADKWAYAEVDTEIISSFVTQAIPLDNLDAVLPGGIDANSINVDSTAFQGGALNLLAFDGTHTAATFDGTQLPAQLETGDFGGIDNRLMMANGVRPLVEGVNTNVYTLRIGTKDTLQSNTDYSSLLSVNSYNEFNFKKKARYMRFQLNIGGTGGFDHARGVIAQAKRQRGRK